MVTALGEETLGEEDDVVTMLDLSDEDLKMMEYTDVDSMDSEVELTPNYSDDEMATQIDMQTDAQNQAQTDTPGTTVSAVSPGVVSLNDAKILKEQTRAQNKASLMEIVNSAELSDSAKQAAVDSLVKLTELSEKEIAAEILLEAKGFTDAIVSMNEGTVDVVVSVAELTDVQKAQIEDIVNRKTGVEIQNIIISPAGGN